MMMSTVTTVTSSSNQSDAAAAQAARSRLELLSNTAMLKKVLDNEEQKRSSTPAALSATQAKDATAATTSPSITGISGANLVSREVSVQTPEIQKPVAVGVEKSSLPPALTSSNQNASTLSPFATLVAASPPGGHHATLTPPSSYASLLAPSSNSSAKTTGTPVSLASTPVAAGSHRPMLPSLSLAHLPSAMQHAMAMMATANTMYGSGGPSSAFRKPYLAPTNGNPAMVTASPSMEFSSRASPTQAPGENEQRAASYEALLQENLRLKQEVAQKDEAIASLQAKANGLEKQIVELRQLPTGKISHIPIE